MRTCGKLFICFLFVSANCTNLSDGIKQSPKNSISEEENISNHEKPTTDIIPHIRHRGFRYLNNPFDLRYCTRPAKCEPLNSTTCFGVKIPYHSTTLDLTDLPSQEMVQDKLHLFDYLRYIPKCWAVIQPFLCALYMPKCVNNTGYLPSREMCKITLQPCLIFYNNSMFQEFFNCDDERLFPSHCKNDVLELRFNTTPYCMKPLVKTDEKNTFHPDLEGCGLQCKDAFYNEREQYQIHKLIFWGAFIGLLLNLFAVITFIIDWKYANKYPAVAIFYVNFCFMVSHVGWLIQFLSDETREDIVCSKDGTLRRSEPSANENISCVVVFLMVYYGLVAGMVWFGIFGYAWHKSSLQALGKSQERVDKKGAYFHLVAWSLPLVLTITTMALGQVDGDYVTGICFVGFVNMWSRLGLLLTPILATLVVSGYIITRGLIILIKVKIDSKEIISSHSASKIQSNIVRMSVFTLFMVAFCVITFIYHGYLLINTKEWKKGLQNYVLCKLTSFSNDFSHCRHESRPSVAMLQLQLLAVFGTGIAMASWVWCSATISAWSRYLKRKFQCGEETPVKLQRHRLIALAFSKRNQYYQDGKITLDCSTHTDPVGLHFDLNSAPTNDISRTFQENLLRLISRRGAVIDEVMHSSSCNNQSFDSEVSLNVRQVSIESRRNSGDSQMSLQSVNVRHVSIESRRNSGDSELSVQIAELKATRKKLNTRRHRSRSRSKKRRNYGRSSCDILSSNLSRTESKHDSKTSLDSHSDVIAYSSRKGPNLNRRNANAGLEDIDIEHLNRMLSKGRLMIPYNSTDNDEGSLTVSESK